MTKLQDMLEEVITGPEPYEFINSFKRGLFECMIECATILNSTEYAKRFLQEEKFRLKSGRLSMLWCQNPVQPTDNTTCAFEIPKLVRSYQDIREHVVYRVMFNLVKKLEAINIVGYNYQKHATKQRVTMYVDSDAFLDVMFKGRNSGQCLLYIAYVLYYYTQVYKDVPPEEISYVSFIAYIVWTIN